MLAPDWSAWVPGRLRGVSAAPSAGTCPDMSDLALTSHPDLALTFQCLLLNLFSFILVIVYGLQVGSYFPN